MSRLRAIAALALVLAAVPAGAFSLMSHTYVVEGDERVYQDCWGANHFDQDIAIEANVANIADFVEQLQFTVAVDHLASSINGIGGQGFDFVKPVGISGSAYAYPNVNGRNEVGLADLSLIGSPRGTVYLVLDFYGCDIQEGDIFLDSAWSDWAYNTPEYYGEHYFSETSGTAPTPINRLPRIYARPVILHEMGHLLGLDHSSHSYSMMNYGVYGWTNNPVEAQMAMLPDDREGLRFLYGDSTQETDLAVLNAYYRVDDPETGDGIADQDILCYPTTGVAFKEEAFGLGACGELADGSNGARVFCPGEHIYTRYALANYGTTALDGESELWFSADLSLDRVSGDDLRSSTTHAFAAAANSSYRQTQTFVVPNAGLAGGEFYPIVFANTLTALATEESETNNWIPLPLDNARETIRIGGFTECNTLQPQFNPP